MEFDLERLPLLYSTNGFSNWSLGVLVLAFDCEEKYNYMTRVWTAEQAPICSIAVTVAYSSVSSGIHCSEGYCQWRMWLPWLAQFSVNPELPVFLIGKKSYLMERKSCPSFLSCSASYADIGERKGLCYVGEMMCNSRWWVGPQLYLQLP